jgi:hypothetical protein
MPFTDLIRLKLGNLLVTEGGKHKSLHPLFGVMP